jgi:hypothetical protein
MCTLKFELTVSWLQNWIFMWCKTHNNLPFNVVCVCGNTAASAVVMNEIKGAVDQNTTSFLAFESVMAVTMKINVFRDGTL